jgi:WD40 repeat protein
MFLRAALSFVTVLLLSACQFADKPTKQWQTAVQGIYDGTLSRDGTKLVIGSIHHGASLWDTRKFARLFSWNHQENEYTQVLTTAMSPDGRYALTAAIRDLVLWDTESGKAVWYWTAPGDIYDADLSIDGRFALLGLSNFNAEFFDIRNGGVLRTFKHQGPIRAVALSGNGRLAITGAEDLTARIWNISTGKEIQRLWHDNQVRLVLLSDDGKLALTDAALEPARIWNVATGTVIHELDTRHINLTSARFSQDNRRLLVGTTNRLVQLWNVQTGEREKSWRLPQTSGYQYSSSSVVDLAFTNQRLLLALASDGYLFLLKP